MPRSLFENCHCNEGHFAECNSAEHHSSDCHYSNAILLNVVVPVHFKAVVISYDLALWVNTYGLMG